MACLRVSSAAVRSASDEANEFKPPPQMQEIVISFLTRMAFLLGDATKEPDFMASTLNPLTPHLLIAGI